MRILRAIERRFALVTLLVVAALFAIIWPRLVAECLFTDKHDAIATHLANGKREALL